MIGVFKPSLGQEEIDAVAEVLRSGWLGLGPKTAEFEKKFSEYVESKYAIATNSATGALHLACLAAGIKDGDEVIVPAITFVSTAFAPVYCGATPVFVDVGFDFNIDVNDIEGKLTNRTKAIIPIHYGGYPCNLDAIWEIAKAHNLIVIEDAAHASGSEYRGNKIGSLQSDFTCFSFHAVKNMTTGDGGMITTHSAEHNDLLRKLRWCGINKSTWKRTEVSNYDWFYESIT